MARTWKKRIDFATEVFAKHGSAIRAMIRSHVGSLDEEEDIYMSLYLRLVKDPVPPGTSNILSYLSTLIRKDIIDAARRRESYGEMISRYAVLQKQTRSGESHAPCKEALLVRCFVDKSVDDQAMVQRVADLCRAMNRYHIYCGGSGLMIDDWEMFVPRGAAVEELV